MVASRIYPDDKPDHDSAVPLGTSKNLLREPRFARAKLRVSAQYLRRSLRFFEVPLC